MTFETFALVWPFASIGLAICVILAFYWYLDRRERRRVSR